MHPHTELIRLAVEKTKATSYLEIGVHRPEHNHHLIPCQFKVGVDPNPDSHATFTGTSDEFFKTYTPSHRKSDYDLCSDGVMFDVIFIDGLHWSEQVKKDFENSLRLLNPNGIILIHDTDPKEERFSVYPRKEPRRWNGDVYKFITQLPKYSGIDWRTPDTDANGTTVVKRSTRVSFDPPFENCDWQTFRDNRKDILQLCTLEEFKAWI